MIYGIDYIYIVKEFVSIAASVVAGLILHYLIEKTRGPKKPKR